MNNSSPDHRKTELQQASAAAAASEEDTLMQDTVEEPDHITYRYVKMATNTEIPLHQVHLESPDVNLGDVVEIDAANGKKDYFSVDHINVEQNDAGEISTVYLIRARNSLWKSLLLLAILGVSWYVIDFILNHLL